MEKWVSNTKSLNEQMAGLEKCYLIFLNDSHASIMNCVTPELNMTVRTKFGNELRDLHIIEILSWSEQTIIKCVTYLCVQFPQGSRIEVCHFVAKKSWPGHYGEVMQCMSVYAIMV